MNARSLHQVAVLCFETLGSHVARANSVELETDEAIANVDFVVTSHSSMGSRAGDTASH